MESKLFRGCLEILCRSFIVIIFILFQISNPVHAKGKGPIGVWPASDRYLLIADSSLPGLVLIDLVKGITIERLVMKDANPTGIASCQDCRFALMTGTGGDTWRIHFSNTIKKLIEKTGSIGLADARIEKINHHLENVNDGRICLVAKNGEAGYIASLMDSSVFRIDLTEPPKAEMIWRDFPINKSRKKGRKPYGLNWGNDGTLLVAMHKKEVHRINTKGEKINVYFPIEAGCPGADLNPNLRSAIDDPTRPNSIIVLASKPRSYDAVIWRIEDSGTNKLSCTSVAGKIGRDSGWLDGAGETIEFSRPHYLTIIPDAKPYRIAVTDIDNRALRIINLRTNNSTTVMYDRDRILGSSAAVNLKSVQPCSNYEAKNVTSATTVLGKKSCIVKQISSAAMLNYTQANAYCKSQGVRLCEPSELRQNMIEKDMAIWTSAECASCWYRKPESMCDNNIKTFRSSGTHKTKGFLHSWHSGHAVEKRPGSSIHSETVCMKSDDATKAAVQCCADVF